MSVSSLPEWKQLLLERKRREEVERERREKEEEEKLASMPAWKRGIIQRRKARQESLGDREKDRDVCLSQGELRSLSDGLSDTDSSVALNPGSDPSLSPDPGLLLDPESQPAGQVSAETIVPVHENPFIRTQSAWRKGRDADVGYEAEVKATSRVHDVELKTERFRDLSEGREKERTGRDRSRGRERDGSREAWEKEKGPWKEAVKDLPKARKDDEEEKETPVPCLRTIRADNIIIIEQDRRCGDDKRGKWRDVDRERLEEEHQGKRAVKMDLREILAGGGSVTEIRASDVLIIKPPAGVEERSPPGEAGGKGSGREDGEAKGNSDGRREGLSRELRTDVSWLRDKATGKEKERPCGQATVIKEDRKDSSDDSVFVERGGRVSQLLSRFGEHPKPPSRSKSSDNFLQPERRKFFGDLGDRRAEGRAGDGGSSPPKGVPKRSFSFSDRVLCVKENGLDGEGCSERRPRERIHSDKGAGWETVKVKLGCARLLEKDVAGKHKHGKDEREQRRREADALLLNQVKKVEPAERKAGEAEGNPGFTMAYVQNTEGISFAKRIPIRQDGKARAAERDGKPPGADREAEARGHGRKDPRREEAPQNAGPASPKSAATEAPGLPGAVGDVGVKRSGSQEPSVLSLHTEELITKIEKIGDTTVYCQERVRRAAKENEPEGQVYGEGQGHDVAARSPKRTASAEAPPGPLEIQIPRTVFYVAEEVQDKKKDYEGGQGVERRDSWRVGKPLSRIESLREKIRQKELERLKRAEDKGADGEETEREQETEASLQKRTPGGEQGQEEAPTQTSVAVNDSVQEVRLLRTCPQLPVPASPADRGEEVSDSLAAASSEAAVDAFRTSEDKDDPSEEPLRHSEEEEKEVSADETQECTSTLDSPPSSSPPDLNSLAAMSRIYNLETVGSRLGLCLRERDAEVSSVHLVKVRPIVSAAHQGDGKVFSGEDLRGVQAIQRQIEQFQLKEQEVLQTQHVAASPPNVLSRDREAKVQPVKGIIKPQLKDDVKSQEKDQEKSESSPKASPQHVSTPSGRSDQTVAVAPSLPGSRSPDVSPVASDSAPTPAPSPAQSPSVSPSLAPSPPLFSIRSVFGGHAKRGATITINPKKSVGGDRPSGTGKPPEQQVQTAAEPGKKKYPKVEEIQVIGGYQSLEKSCLVKSKGTPRRVKVCFDEDQLEQVCEYPSETSALACTPFPPEPGRWEPPGEEDDDDHEERNDVDGGATVSKGSRSVGISTGHGLRVGQCHPLLKKHSV